MLLIVFLGMKLCFEFLGAGRQLSELMLSGVARIFKKRRPYFPHFFQAYFFRQNKFKGD